MKYKTYYFSGNKQKFSRFAENEVINNNKIMLKTYQ